MTSPYPGNANWPAHWGACTLTGQFVGADGLAIVGSLTLLMRPLEVFVPLDEKMIPARAITIILATDGAIMGLDGDAETPGALIPASDDPHCSPNGWTYQVTENWDGGRTYDIKAPLGQTVDMTQVAPAGSYEGVLVLAQAGAINLTDLKDVEITNLLDGQALVYDLALGKWINKDVETGGGTATPDSSGGLDLTGFGATPDGTGGLDLTDSAVTSDGAGGLTITV